MELMKDSFSRLADMPEVASLRTAFNNPLLGVLVGAVFTGIIQSSAASVGILQALALTGSITYGMAIPIIMGQNIATGEVLILVTGHENDVNAKGMTSIAAANILLQRGATIAVELCEGESAAACDKGQLMFTPETKTVPTAYCFWYITRRRFEKNDYERELAELM